MTFNTMTLSIESHYAGCCFADCSDYLNVMMSVVRLNVMILNAIMQSVSMLSVAAPKKGLIVLTNAKILFNSNRTIFLGLRHGTMRYNKP